MGLMQSQSDCTRAAVGLGAFRVQCDIIEITVALLTVHCYALSSLSIKRCFDLAVMLL